MTCITAQPCGSMNYYTNLEKSDFNSNWEFSYKDNLTRSTSQGYGHGQGFFNMSCSQPSVAMSYHIHFEKLIIDISNCFNVKVTSPRSKVKDTLNNILHCTTLYVGDWLYFHFQNVGINKRWELVQTIFPRSRSHLY